MLELVELPRLDSPRTSLDFDKCAGLCVLMMRWAILDRVTHFEAQDEASPLLLLDASAAYQSLNNTMNFIDTNKPILNLPSSTINWTA